MVDSTLLETRLQAVESADSAQGMVDAVEALAELQDTGATDMLIRVLGYNNPGAAVAAVEGLIKIGTPAASAVLAQIDGYNYGARAWALRVLAGIGDPRGLDLVRETAAEDFSLSVRRAAARGLGAIQWEKMADAERREAQMKARDTLLKVLEDPEWVVRYGAVVGLKGVAAAAVRYGFDDLIAPVLVGLGDRAQQDETPAVQARAQWALVQISKSSISESSVEQ
ncbi:MAG: phycocyanobilin lyase [Leptolyngbya foveolarum]|uniref:Phycocyanobilin lyase n=1 Tax=Leptolyngbya foveolarum TaxID=47253 RepID=A0A2W4TST9_9CYAN|nr:MAG: phycocyanobilin lyase [Leptolyngbya foveolarum]